MSSGGSSAGSKNGRRLHRDSGDRKNSQHFKRFGHKNFKKTEDWNWQVNYDYIREHQNIEVEIVSPDQIEIEAAEMDEMWSFVQNKSQQYWLWWAIDHNTGVPLAYCFGTREHKYLDELCALLAQFNIKIIYADDNFAYKNHIKKSKVINGKKILKKSNVNIYLCALGAAG